MIRANADGQVNDSHKMSKYSCVQTAHLFETPEGQWKVVLGNLEKQLSRQQDSPVNNTTQRSVRGRQGRYYCFSDAETLILSLSMMLDHKILRLAGIYLTIPVNPW